MQIQPSAISENTQTPVVGSDPTSYSNTSYNPTIVRLHEDVHMCRLLLRTIKHVYNNRSDDDILSDAPASWVELRKWESDRESDGHVSGVKTTRSRVRVTVKSQKRGVSFTHTVST